jgi:CheY-like chemotaxis protein
MPVMLGKEVAERLTTTRPGVRVLFMSGYAQPESELTGEVIDKPFTETALLGRLRTMLASREAL